MKFSCIPVSYFEKIIKQEMSTIEWVLEAKKIGFDYADLSILFFKDFNENYLKIIREKINESGIKIAIINAYPDFTNPQLKIRVKELKKIKKYICVAEFLDAKYVRITAGQAHPETNKKNGLKWAIEGLVQAAEFSKDKAIQLLFENHYKGGIWDYKDFAFPTDIFLEIYKHIKSQSIKILFDTANTLAYGDNPLMVLDKIIEDVVCIHAADIERRESFNPVLIGTGIVPFKEIFTNLNNAGFNGIISIEEASNTKKAGIVIAEKFVRKMWNEVITR